METPSEPFCCQDSLLCPASPTTQCTKQGPTCCSHLLLIVSSKWNWIPECKHQSFQSETHHLLLPLTFHVTLCKHVGTLCAIALPFTELNCPGFQKHNMCSRHQSEMGPCNRLCADVLKTNLQSVFPTTRKKIHACKTCLFQFPDVCFHQIFAETCRTFWSKT